MALTPAEKQRRYRLNLKQNTEKNAEAQRKHRERYHAKKTLVKDMTEREHRAAKRKWKIANKKRREHQKTAQKVMVDTPNSTTISIPRSGTPLSSKSRSLRRVRRDRSAVYRKNIKLQEELETMKKKINKYKKRYQRAKKTKKTNEDPDQKKKYTTLCNAIKDHYKRLKTLKEKVAIRRIFQEEGISKSKLKTIIFREALGINQLKHRETVPTNIILREKIKSFFDRDDVSRATAGKRETVTYRKGKLQKRYLLDTMKNLHCAFNKENPDEQCLYSYFIKHRPFYVKPPTVYGRETCLCKLHTNAHYMINALYKKKIILNSNMNNLIASIVCSTDRRDCMTGNCKDCKIKKIPYNIRNDLEVVEWAQWIRKSEIIEKSDKKVKIFKNVKETVKGTVEELTSMFNQTLKELKKHLLNIKTQYRSYRAAIDNLKSDEIVLHIDFSENYNCKYFEEVQSHHFGGSRKQVTLHTGVMYTKSETEDKPTVNSFCTISSNNSHNPASIWAHLHPIIKTIKVEFRHIKIIHFFSDGPATQYRQKLNFHFICTKTFHDYNFDRVTWNFFEAGHGKGAADGVGGYLKRTADEKVATGSDISDAETFFYTLKNLSRVRLYLVTDNDIQNVEKTVPKTLIPLQGTMQVHQVFTATPGELQYRHLSCFCQRGFCTCLNPKLYRPVPNSDIPVQNTITDSDVLITVPSLEYRMNEEEILADILNILAKPRRIYDTIYSSSDEEPLSKLTEPSVSNVREKKLIELENVHPSKISNGVYVLVKVSSVKDKHYTYLGEAKSEVYEEGDVMIMFYKTADSTGKRFKAIKTDVSYEPYENILKIVPAPKRIMKGKREFFEFDQSLNVFEK